MSEREGSQRERGATRAGRSEPARTGLSEEWAQSEVPARSRGVIALLAENCTSCMLCVRECPDWCIYLESHQETVEVPGARPRQRNVLDRFAIDYGLCMYCGICVEVCPFDALFWSPEHEYAATDVAGLTQERDQLQEWLGSAPQRPPG